MNSDKVIQKKPEDTEQADYISTFSYYQLFGIFLVFLIIFSFCV